MYEKVFIVAGHGSNNGHLDPGAIAVDGTTEREIVASISGLVNRNFESYDGKLPVLIGKNEDITIQEKTQEINSYCDRHALNYKNSLLVSIHADWRGAPEGVGGYFYTGSSTSQSLLRSVTTEVAKVGGRKLLYEKPDSQSNYGRLGIIQDPIPLAVLVECGSLMQDENDNDGLELLKSKKGQEEIAYSIFVGILKFIGRQIPEKPSNTDCKKVKEANSAMWMKCEDAITTLRDIQSDLSEINNSL